MEANFTLPCVFYLFIWPGQLRETNGYTVLGGELRGRPGAINLLAYAWFRD